jgi:nitrogen fixation NifU-like protein
VAEARDDLDMEYVVELARAFDSQVKNHVVASANVEFEDSNPLCGDKFKVALRVNEQGEVEDIGFSGRGCAISRASAYLLAEMVRGQDVKTIDAITRDKLIDELGVEIHSAVRLKCANLALRTVKTGLNKVGYTVGAAEEDSWTDEN